jgi:hypothetical protein
MFYLTKIRKRLFRITHLDSILGEMGTWLTISMRYGHFKSSFLRKPIGAKGKKIPWYSYAAIDYLDSLDFSKMTVLEYGGGNSSFWWASRCLNLVTIESEFEWHQRLLELNESHQNLDFQFLSTKQDYVGAVEKVEANVVIIDGLYRGECVSKILDLPKFQSTLLRMIIFDNSNWFPKSVERLTQGLEDFTRVDFSSLSSINSYPHTTSIFLNRTGTQLGFKSSFISPTGARLFIHPEDY